MATISARIIVLDRSAFAAAQFSIAAPHLSAAAGIAVSIGIFNA
jgi:hypothetical protein